jgi:hypothetical protein
MDWVEDMFAYRNLTISHGDITIEVKPDKGCAQGVDLSSLLWCVMVNDLEDLQPLSGRNKASSSCGAVNRPHNPYSPCV